MAGFPKSTKLDKLHSFFTEQAKYSNSKRSDYRRTEELDNEWTTWDDNWDRVIYRGLLNNDKFRKTI